MNPELIAKTLYVADNWRRNQAADDWATEGADYKEAYFKMASAIIHLFKDDE